MMFGEVLLYCGFAAFIVALISCFYGNVRGRGNLKLIHYSALKIGSIFLSLSFLLLVYYFISNDFSIYYVWLYSSKDMPFFYKLAAVWAGQQGSFMFWTLLGSLSLFWLEGKKEDLKKRSLLIAESVVIFLFLLTIMTEPFKPMSQFEHLGKAAASDGAGLDPELLSPWMMIHPPITFIAYATSIIPFAAALSYFLGGGNWIALSRKWAELSWLFFSLGVGLIGGIWTYEAGWGIWTWDASEAGSLIPWLLLTAALHQNKRQRTRAALFIAAFISILFAAFIIRSGLWGSVHEFSGTAVNNILGGGIVALVFMTLLLLMKYSDKLDLRISRESLSLAVMLVVSAIVLIGLCVPLYTRVIGDEASVGAEFYNLSLYPFSLLLLILLGMCLLGKDGYAIGIMAGASGIILAFVRPSEAFMLIDSGSSFFQQSSSLTKAYSSLSILSMIPPAAFALYAVVRRVHFRPDASSLIHLGVVLLFLGGIYSTSFARDYTIHFLPDDIGKTISVENYEIRLSGFLVNQNQRGNWVQRASLEVMEGENIIGTASAGFTRDRSGDYASRGIIRMPLADMLITFPGLEPSRDSPPVIPLDVRIYPLLNIFWFGDILLSLGILLRLIGK